MNVPMVTFRYYDLLELISVKFHRIHSKTDRIQWNRLNEHLEISQNWYELKIDSSLDAPE